MRAHAFLHVSFEGLGSIESWLREKGYTITYTRFYEEAMMDIILERTQKTQALMRSLLDFYI